MNTPKKKYLLFPKINLKHLLFLFFLIVACIKKGVQIYFEKNQRLAVEFLKLYMYDVGDFLSIIPFLIMKKRMENERDDDEMKKIIIKYTTKYMHFNPNDKKFKFNAFRNLLIFSIVDFIAQISSVIYYIVKEDQKLVVKQANLNCTLIFNIIFIIIFSILILHTKFYRHHLFAFSVDAFCFIILTIIELTNLFKDVKENVGMSITYILIKILSALLYSLENVIAKYLFLFNFVSSYFLLFCKSMFHFVFLVIFSSPFITKEIGVKDGEPRNIFSMIGEIFEDKKYYFIVIGYTIISFFYNNLCFKIIDFFSPNHFTISRLLENIGIFVMDLIINGAVSTSDMVVKIIMYIILTIAALIYNEFLVINICGLAKNTKLFLDYEAEDELAIGLESDNYSDKIIETTDCTFGIGGFELEDKSRNNLINN